MSILGWITFCCGMLLFVTVPWLTLISEEAWTYHGDRCNPWRMMAIKKAQRKQAILILIVLTQIIGLVVGLILSGS